MRFEHLDIEAEAHVGSRALPSFLNYIIELGEGLLSIVHLSRNRKKHIKILHDVSGVIKPNRY